MPRELAARLAPAFLLLCAALASGCWMRVRTAGYVPTAGVVGTGGGEVHAVYLARPGVPGGETGGASAGAYAGAAVAVPSSAAWSPGAATVAGASDLGATVGAEATVEAEASAFASATAGWTWSATTGWTRAGGTDASGGAGGSAGVGTAGGLGSAGGASATSSGLWTDATATGATYGGAGGTSAGAGGTFSFPPRLGGATPVTGAGARLSALATVGVTVRGCACSTEGEIAALSRLVPLPAGRLGAGAVVLGDAAVSIELVPAHDALGPSGGATSIAVRVRGGAAPATPPPLRVHLVIDASTSMRSRWPEVKDAALALVRRLRPEDELQIVVYGDGATVALAPSPVGDGSAARAVVRGLRCGGRTNIEAGLRAAYAATVSEGSIVLLLSDGVPLGGAATPAELGQLAADARAAHGATTFAVGLGSEFHPGILHALATAGGGDFRIAPRTAELEAILTGALAAHGRIVARDVVVDLELPPGVTLDASASLAAGLSASGGRLHLAVPSVAAESETVVLVPVVAAGGTTLLAEARAGWSARGSHASAAASVRVAAGAEAIASGGIALSLDVELGATLAAVATLVENGDGAAARASLEAHASHVEAIAASRPDAALSERARASRALGISLGELVPPASFAERRQTAAAILEWSLSFAALRAP